ncbi:MAG: hypothetical protein V3U75_13030 [Methylococcaceae bacterium]
MARKATGPENNVAFVAIAGTDGEPLNPSVEGKQDTQISQLGEVEETPAQFTLLRRIKDLLTGIKLAAGNNNIGGVELVDPSNDTRLAKFDSKVKVPIIQQTEHGEIHGGTSFERHIDSGNAAVATLNVAFKTLAGTKLAHMIFGFASNDEIKYEIIEGATWTQGTGTALPILNHNRAAGASTVILENKNQALFTASNQVIQDVTGISGGTVIDLQYTYNAGLGASVVAENRNAVHEWVLKPDTTYIVRMTQTDGNCKMSMVNHWYEHTDE